MNLQQAIEGYIVNSQVENKTAKTVSNIQWDLDRFLKWKGDMPLDRISTQDIRQYILHHQSRGLSGYSLHDIYKVLRAFFRWTVREELIQRDPTVPIAPPKLPQLLPKILASGQLKLHQQKHKADLRQLD
jgi:site-specific recombinase XerD